MGQQRNLEGQQGSKRVGHWTARLSAAVSAGAVCLIAAFAGTQPAKAADFDKEWKELQAAAKAEGELVLSTGALPQFQPLFDAFSQKFGISVKTDGGSGSSRATRILAERRADRFTVDVVMMSVAGTTRRLEPAGALVPLPSLLIHPEVTDKSKWFEKQHWYVDEKGRNKVFVYSARAENMWRFWYNTDKISAEEIASIKTPMDILNPKWKGRLADRSWSDPGRLGGMLDMYFAPDAGPEWIKKYFTQMDVTFTGDSRLEESWLIRGSKPLKWKEGDIHEILLKYMHKFPIKPVDLPRARGKLEARGSECCIAIAEKAPHPNAAKLFVNWFLSKEGQNMVHKAKPSRPYTSLREDVEPGNTSKIYRRIQGKEYWFRDFDTGYLDREKEARKFIIATYQGPKDQDAVHAGKVVKVERAGRKVTIDYKGKKVAARLSSSQTKVTIAGKSMKRKDVKVGMNCTFTYPGPGQVAKKVECK